MDAKIGTIVLYTDPEGKLSAAIVVGTLEQTEAEDKEAGKEGRSFTLARLSVFTEGGGLSSVGAEFDDGGKPGTWGSLEGKAAEVKPKTK